MENFASSSSFTHAQELEQRRMEVLHSFNALKYANILSFFFVVELPAYSSNIYIYKNINGSYQGCLLKQGCHLAAVGDLGSARTPRLAKIETAAFATCFRNVGK